MRPAFVLFLCLAAVAACADGAPESNAVSADSVTQRQRDSAIGASRLPGAQGVRGALDASDAADARAAAHDSLSGGH